MSQLPLSPIIRQKLGSRSSTESVRAIVTSLSEDCQPVTGDVTTQPSQAELTNSS